MLFEFIKKMVLIRGEGQGLVLELINHYRLETVLKYKYRIVANLAEPYEDLKDV